MTNVVVVDDYVDFAKSLKELIEKFNDAKCIAFSNSFDVLKHLENEKNVDIVITDYQMPRMNGFELAEIILEKFPKMRVIVSSGYDKTDLKQICEEYELDGKIEVVCKDDMEFFMRLI